MGLKRKIYISLASLIVATFCNTTTLACEALTANAIPPCNESQLVYGTCFNPDMDKAIALTKSECFRDALANVALQANTYLNQIEPSPNKVILTDLDDTLINNTAYYEVYKTFDPKIWFEWAKQYTNGPYNSELNVLLKEAKAKGFTIMFITGRPPEQTIDILRQTSDVPWDGFFFKPKTIRISSADFKAGVREMLRDMGYEIVLTLGDQNSDFDLPIEPEKGEFILPNVLYTIP